MYKLEFKPQARKAILRMPRNTAHIIRGKLENLRENPALPNNNVTRLKGTDGYRLRVGDWRVIFRLNNKELEILVIKISPRGGAYQ